MTQSKFPLIRSTKPLATGPPQYEDKRRALLEAFYDKIPAEYRLPEKLLDNPPCDMTTIPSTCGILTPEEVKITEEYDAVGLAKAIAAKELTVVAVTTAFCKRSIIAHQLSCCLTQWFMEEALSQARYLDEYLEKNGRVIGPLHGVPISIKAHIPIAGTESNMGYLATVTEDREDSQMVKILRDLGAVFYCKTHQPQALMHLESTSFWGRTLNPYNINLSAGGSSGGESALIALKGSLLGVGTDIGGSIRGPAGFCGIYGFKPTSYTLPMQGFLPGGVPAELNVLVSTGPMCRTMRDMELFMSSLLGAKPYLEDTRLVPIPWTGLGTSQRGKPLKVGFMTNDGVIQPQPPVTRALEWAHKLLLARSDLFDVKPYHPYQPMEAYRMIRMCYWPDGGIKMRQILGESGEPMHPLSQWTIKDAESNVERTASELIGYRVARDDFRSAFAKHWNAQDIDVVIAPTFIGPACAHDTAWYWNYTYLWNFVDYPAVVVPTPIKAEAGEKYSKDNEAPLSESCQHIRQLWADTDFSGAPIGLQVIARRYHDNELFGALAVLQHALQLP
ncbi:hypothetical protein PHISCL_00014 [Aspergillus sclerotialis]|uniref:amidase n=1 Tax=Aspergillus sclerotialis TaxID=2070753 RepID=A0A3A2ZWQ2_9EURO|nr:hypothetical protein PHISCL_00014 [Aspergillus sclerotialis]